MVCKKGRSRFLHALAVAASQCCGVHFVGVRVLGCVCGPIPMEGGVSIELKKIHEKLVVGMDCNIQMSRFFTCMCGCFFSMLCQK